MLVLNRSVDEAILIGNDIRILVIANGRDYVRLGIDAPRHINIVREELLNDDRRRIRHERKDS